VFFSQLGYWKDLFRTGTCLHVLLQNPFVTLRLVVLKRPGFPSQKYGMHTIKLCNKEKQQNLRQFWVMSPIHDPLGLLSKQCWKGVELVLVNGFQPKWLYPAIICLIKVCWPDISNTQSPFIGSS